MVSTSCPTIANSKLYLGNHRHVKTEYFELLLKLKMFAGDIWKIFCGVIPQKRLFISWKLFLKYLTWNSTKLELHKHGEMLPTLKLNEITLLHSGLKCLNISNSHPYETYTKFKVISPSKVCKSTFKHLPCDIPEVKNRRHKILQHQNMQRTSKEICITILMVWNLEQFYSPGQHYSAKHAVLCAAQALCNWGGV